MIFKYREFRIKKTKTSFGLFRQSLLIFESNSIDDMFKYIEQYERNEKLNELTKFLFLS